MCIFAQPVVSVTDTNIFARMLSDDWQYLVYQMNFQTSNSNAIILPLPVQLPAADEGSLQFVSLKDYERFFPDLAKGFPIARPKSRSRSGAVDSLAMPSNSVLRVHEVGDFIASFVPTLRDFDRLDAKFRVPQESWDQIPKYSDYGFAVFQLKSLRGKPHPMAFKFKSRLSSAATPSIFFPTVHIHDGKVHRREEFDHTLYLQAPQYDKVCGEYQQRPRLVVDRATGYVRSKWNANKFCDIKAAKGIVDPDQLVHRVEMRGLLKNDDVLASQDPAQRNRLGSWLPADTWGPLAVGGAGLMGLQWLFDRRNQVADRLREVE